MGIEDLEKAGMLLPREEWGKRELTTDVAKVPLVALFALVPVSAVLVWFGDGGPLTWIGIGLYFVFLAGFTALSLSGIR